MIAAQRLAANWSLDGDINCIVYSLFCKFIIIIIIIIITFSSSSSMSTSFVALLNVFISTHKFPLLSIFPPHPAMGEGEG